MWCVGVYGVRGLWGVRVLSLSLTSDGAVLRVVYEGFEDHIIGEHPQLGDHRSSHGCLELVRLSL